MRAKIHPKTFNNAKVTCTCGATFVTTSTVEAINVEVCSNCHPFYTGIDKFVDTEGIVDKFNKKQQVTAKKKEERKAIDAKKKEASTRPTTGTLTLKDLLKQSKK